MSRSDGRFDLVIPGYRIKDEIAKGGMATVYVAIQESLERRVALKIMSPSSAADPPFQKRFSTEGRIIAQLNHPNIVTVYDIGSVGSGYYMAMEYVGGGSLGQWLGRDIPIAQALEIIRQIAQALDFAHSHGVVHRDVKPGNILFREDGTAVLSDFGIAGLLHSKKDSSLTGYVTGTPEYMSPEQAADKPLDPRSDLYSLGVVLYELLTRQKPFVGGDASATAMRHKNAPLPELPATLRLYQQILDRLLAKDPAERFSTASELVKALDRLTARAQMRAESMSRSAERSTPAGPPSGTWRWAALLSLILVLLASVTWSGDVVAFRFVWLLYLAAGTLTIGLIYSALQRRRQKGPRQSSLPLKEDLPQGNRQHRHSFSPPSAGFTIIAPLASKVIPESEKRSDARASPVGDATVFLQSVSSVKQPALPDVALAITQCPDASILGTKASVTHAPFWVGRSDEADLVIRTDPRVSRKHVILDFQSGAFTVRDAGSQNGTYLNGKLVPSDQAARLLFGDHIRLSTNTVFTFVSGELHELPDLTGKLIDDRYLVNKRLHFSSKAAVYAAEDQSLPQTVAVKVLSPQLAAYPGYIEQFRREAETAAQLQHPYICRVLAFRKAPVEWKGNETEQIDYLCMELMDGGSLPERVADNHLIALDRIAVWLQKLGEALDYAHREGVIHRGIKLTSVVFDKGDNPYLTDFALATTHGDPDNGPIAGAPAFLAPEQWEGYSIPATDQYSLAVLTYLLVTGSHPYEGQENPDVRKHNFARGAIPAHEEAAQNGRNGVPAAVSKVLQQAMAMKPEKRYPSVGDFAYAFARAVSKSIASTTLLPQVFISYQREPSAGWAVLFAKELNKTHRISAFFDTQGPDNAVRFPERLQRAIEDCDVFICLLANSTLGSAWVTEEIRLAYQNRKPMVPVFQESYSPPSPNNELPPHIETLLSYDGVHLLDHRNIHVDYTIEQIARIVKQTMARSSDIRSSDT